MYNATTFSFDPDGKFIFPLTVWITEMRIQNLLGIEFQPEVSFCNPLWSTWDWDEEPSKANLLWQFQ